MNTPDKRPPAPAERNDELAEGSDLNAVALIVVFTVAALLLYWWLA